MQNSRNKAIHPPASLEPGRGRGQHMSVGNIRTFEPAYSVQLQGVLRYPSSESSNEYDSEIADQMLELESSDYKEESKQDSERQSN